MEIVQKSLVNLDESVETGSNQQALFGTPTPTPTPTPYFREVVQLDESKAFKNEAVDIGYLMTEKGQGYVLAATDSDYTTISHGFSHEGLYPANYKGLKQFIIHKTTHTSKGLPMFIDYHFLVCYFDVFVEVSK